MKRDTPVRTATVTMHLYWSPSRKSWSYVARDEAGRVLAIEIVDSRVELDRTNVELLLRELRRFHEGLLPF